MMRTLTPAFAFAFACLSLAPLAAQQAKPALMLRTTAGQTTFHIGERIALQLTLTGPDNQKYSIDTASYDRSGRLDIDTFEVSPGTGWVDPLAQYFSNGSFDGGGLFGSEILSSKPVSFNADLNEHIRFGQPGTYTVTATSHRVGTMGKNLFPGTPFLAIRSNTLEIRIIPATPQWQAEKLRSILAALAAIQKLPMSQTSSHERAGIIADLRFLDSPASIEVLASHLRDGLENTDSQFMWAAALGLSGVPDALRDTAIGAMSNQLEQPDFPVNSFFLTIMANLEASPNEPSRELLASRRPEFKTVWQLALGCLSHKQGAALAATAEALLSDAPDGEAPEVKARIVAAVANSFIALPIDRQISQLEDNWDELSKQPMLPVLEALLHQPPPKLRSPFFPLADLHAIALKRWYELDPEGALREVTAQLAASDAALSPESVESLPGGPQPQLEARWTAELVESENDQRQMLLAALLVRFGTGSATAQVEGKLDSLVGKWSCAPQAAALAYLVKFDPRNAGTFVQRALASTTETQCYKTLFSSVSHYAHGAALNEAAIGGLQSFDPGAAADAAEYLRYFGTESARQPLLERYREWSEHWAGRPGDIDPGTESGYPENTLGRNLGKALIANQGWLADPKLTAEVVHRCVGEEMCNELQQLASAGSSPTQNVEMSRFKFDEKYSIGPYECRSLELFEAKLAQFPAGTRFTLIPSSPRNGDQLKLDREVEAIFTRQDRRLELPAPRSVTTAALP